MSKGGLPRKKIDESLLSAEERERRRLERLQADMIEELGVRAAQAGVLQSLGCRHDLLVATVQLARVSLISQSGKMMVLSVHPGILKEFTAETVSIIEQSAGRVLGTAVSVELVVDRR